MWTPRMAEGDGLRFEGLVEAIAEDIAAGRLAPGDRLPPQRETAYRLGLGLGTVTRAYAEAERRGLLTAQVGRGSFVAETAAGAASGQAGARIDFSRNLPPLAPARAHLAGALAALRRRPDIADELDYAPPEGRTRDRRAGQAWIAAVTGWDGPNPSLLACCAGAQQAIFLALEVAAPARAPVIVEEATFWGVKAAAAAAGRPLIPAAMDAEGLRPDALERAARQSGARVAYVLPFQNPTARLMGPARRAAIAQVARRLDLTLIEDDLYAAFRPDDGAPPIAALAPERTFYVSGVSKSLAPGLRAGYLAAPTAEHFERVIAAVRALSYAPPGFGPAIASQWIEDGSAQAIVAAVKAEVRERTALAGEILGDLLEPPASGESLHLWLPMGELEAERLTSRALRLGVDPTPPAAPLVPGGKLTGLRLCIGAPPSRETLRRGLEIIRDAASAAPERTPSIV
ncbi:MAG: PLP-dependent aminotransferase family protein [Caulobacterales bacterium]